MSPEVEGDMISALKDSYQRGYGIDIIVEGKLRLRVH